MTRNLTRTRNRGQDATIWGISDHNNPAPLRVDEDGNLYVNLVNPFSTGGDDDDEGQLLLTDEITGALTTIELQHHEVHEGESFEASYFTLSLANNSSIDFRLPTGNKYCHFVFDCSCGGNAEVQFYASANLAGGTPLTAWNMNRPSANTATLNVYHTPAVIGTGTLVYNAALPGGKGPNAGGGVARQNTEWILKLNTVYLLRLFNRSGSAQPSSIVVQWYEEGTN